jgi:hypothetical protein
MGQFTFFQPQSEKITPKMKFLQKNIARAMPGNFNHDDLK